MAGRPPRSRSTPDKQRWLAELGGKRELFHKTPINTELCYSHPPAFDALIGELAAYAQAHPEVDVLHFWLSDATNNKCECPDCAALSPADWYARLVNTLSERLHQIDPQRRFVFLSYFESWWPPEKHVVESSRGNAIFMFAPIARCFRHALADETCASDSPLQRPALNHVVMPRDNRTYTRFLDNWWKVFTGDSFLFDYHLMWAVHEQVMDTALGQVMHEDMRDLKKLGLNGMVSCQVMRSFWPTGLAMAAMAETLWNADCGVARYAAPLLRRRLRRGRGTGSSNTWPDWRAAVRRAAARARPGPESRTAGARPRGRRVRPPGAAGARAFS